jgi:beta-lactamase superfamily II metal-dependent hydrolase
MIRELDLVVLTHDVNEHCLKVGDLGAVVHRYADEEAFEVEFVTAEGKTIALLTLERGDVRPLNNQEILHVRSLAA